VKDAISYGGVESGKQYLSKNITGVLEGETSKGTGGGTRINTSGELNVHKKRVRTWKGDSMKGSRPVKTEVSKGKKNVWSRTH